VVVQLSDGLELLAKNDSARGTAGEMSNPGGGQRVRPDVAITGGESHTLSIEAVTHVGCRSRVVIRRSGEIPSRGSKL
jgi:hypothetical protein